MAAKPLKADLIAKRLAEHGRHIFAYHHIWTGQTVYSLERVMNNNAVLKQLTFAGKKTLPATIRKDIWRPLFTVTFPSPPQGLYAFRKLREYRKLHELCYSGPTVPNKGLLDLDNPYVKTEVARPPKKERSRIIMDQRANSIADLAAVLREQEELGAAKEKADAEAADRANLKAREEMLALATEERNGGLPVLEKAISAQEAAIADMNAKREAEDTAAPSRRDIHRQNQALNALRLKRRKMIAAKDALEQAQATLVTTPDSSSPQIQGTVEPPAIFYPNSTASSTPLPKRGIRRKQIAASIAPRFTTNGVVVRWANPLDAEFAESWPVAVEHHDAGLLRHTAPHPDREAIMDVEQMLRSQMALEQRDSAEQADLDPMYTNSQEEITQVGTNPA